MPSTQLAALFRRPWERDYWFSRSGPRPVLVLKSFPWLSILKITNNRNAHSLQGKSVSYLKLLQRRGLRYDLMGEIPIRQSSQRGVLYSILCLGYRFSCYQEPRVLSCFYTILGVLLVPNSSPHHYIHDLANEKGKNKEEVMHALLLKGIPSHISLIGT